MDAEARYEHACDLCTSGVTINDRRYCNDPRVIGNLQPQPVRLVRASTLSCGPDAVFLDFPGLNPGLRH